MELSRFFQFFCPGRRNTENHCYLSLASYICQFEIHDPASLLQGLSGFCFSHFGFAAMISDFKGHISSLYMHRSRSNHW